VGPCLAPLQLPGAREGRQERTGQGGAQGKLGRGVGEARGSVGEGGGEAVDALRPRSCPGPTQPQRSQGKGCQDSACKRWAGPGNSQGCHTC